MPCEHFYCFLFGVVECFERFNFFWLLKSFCLSVVLSLALVTDVSRWGTCGCCELWIVALPAIMWGLDAFMDQGNDLNKIKILGKRCKKKINKFLGSLKFLKSLKFDHPNFRHWKSLN